MYSETLATLVGAFFDSWWLIVRRVPRMMMASRHHVLVEFESQMSDIVTSDSDRDPEAVTNANKESKSSVDYYLVRTPNNLMTMTTRKQRVTWFQSWLAMSMVSLCFSETVYYAGDDASWPINSVQMSNVLGDTQMLLYDNFMAGCKEAAMTQLEVEDLCTEQEEIRMEMNRNQPRSVYNYTTNGFKAIKAPPMLYSLIKDFYDANKEEAVVEWDTINTFQNAWEVPSTIVRIEDTEHSGGGADLQSQIWHQAKNILQDWSGQRLAPVSLYGVRNYHRGSVLTPHVDRLPLVVSAIINVDQKGMDEPWPLEVYRHDGKAVNVTMQPGDMVLYESHSVIHGRPYPLKGDLFANIFVHFETVEPLDPSVESAYDPELDLPPYLIPDSPIQSAWYDDHPHGWKGELRVHAREAASNGDSTTLRRIGNTDPDALHEPDELGWYPIHEASRGGSIDTVVVLLEHGADINHETNHGHSPLHIAREHLGDEHIMTRFLVYNGALDLSPEL